MTTTYRSRLLTTPLLTLVAVLCAAVALHASAATPALYDLGPQARQNEKPDEVLLTDEEIDLIRVYEVDLAPADGKPPTIVIPDATLKDFLEKYREDDRIPRGKTQQRAFLRADGYKQLELLFQLRAREYYKDVRVRSQIESLREWNSLHKNYVLGYFREHFGDGEVKGLTLMPQGRDSKRVAMTNFYLLTQTRIEGKALIDRNNPEESLLLQWGLPREEAKFAAPEVDGWQPYFKNRSDERFQEQVDWIKSLVRSNQDSDYDVKFKAPEKKQD